MSKVRLDLLFRNVNPKNSFNCTISFILKILGDSIRKNKTASFGFDETVGFQAVINYPNLGDNEPAIVSYVEIYVIQV